MPVTVAASVFSLTLATLGDLIQIETILFVLYHPRYPKQVFNLLNLLVIVTSAVGVLALATLGDLTQLDASLFVSHHPR
jgi:hypothetical protein